MVGYLKSEDVKAREADRNRSRICSTYQLLAVLILDDDTPRRLLWRRDRYCTKCKFDSYNFIPLGLADTYAEILGFEVRGLEIMAFGRYIQLLVCAS